jgi:sugar phosphate isomerase/epimerase
MAAHGFRSIELYATRTHFDYHDPGAIAALDEWLKDSGMQLHSVHAPISESLVGTRRGLHNGAGPASRSTPLTNASLDEPTRARAVQEAAVALALARQIPFRFFVVHLGQPTSLQPSAGDNQLDAARRSIEELHSIARSLDTRLALEVIPNSISSAETLVRLIEDELEVSDIGVCLDFGHGFLMGDLVDAIETASGYLVTTHVHDNQGQIDEHLVPFEGAIDWPAALMAIQKVGYDGALVMEVANTATSAQVLAATVRARKRFEEILR